MLDDPNDMAIVQGTIGLATAFHREVIAEGVETAAHGRLLQSFGCELAQGVWHCAADACSRPAGMGGKLALSPSRRGLL